MIQVKKHGVILEPTGLPFENRAVLNPAIYQAGESVHIVYRAVSSEGMSVLGYARLKGPLTLECRWDKPFMTPEKPYESRGLEDPRIVNIDGRLLMSYVAHDGQNAISALAEGADIFSLKRRQVASPKITYREAKRVMKYARLKDEYYFYQAFYVENAASGVLVWHKDLVPFAGKVGGRYAFLERILPDTQTIFCDDLSELKDKYYWIRDLMTLHDHIVLEPIYGYETRHVGGGCPPFLTEHGWLTIFHSVEETQKGRVYRASAALLDCNNPRICTHRLPYPLFEPLEEWEKKGDVSNVVFPTGTALFGDELYIYYGAADTRIGACSVSLTELLSELKRNPLQA